MGDYFRVSLEKIRTNIDSSLQTSIFFRFRRLQRPFRFWIVFSHRFPSLLFKRLNKSVFFCFGHFKRFDSTVEKIWSTILLIFIYFFDVRPRLSSINQQTSPNVVFRAFALSPIVFAPFILCHGFDNAWYSLTLRRADILLIDFRLPIMLRDSLAVLISPDRLWYNCGSQKHCH